MRFRFLLVLALLFGVLTALSVAAEPASPAELLSVGRVDDALRALHDRVQAAPNDAQAYNLLTRTYFYMGRWEEAATAAERAVALEPSASNYQLWLGRAVGEKAAHASFVTAVRMVPRIRGAFERAVQLDGASAAARTDLAEFYMEAPSFLGGGKDKALAQAEMLASQDEAAAHWIKARLAERGKQFDTAEREYRAAIAASPHPGGRWLDLAGFYRTHERFDQMEDSVNKAVAEDVLAEHRSLRSRHAAVSGRQEFSRRHRAAAEVPREWTATRGRACLSCPLSAGADLREAGKSPGCRRRISHRDFARPRIRPGADGAPASWAVEKRVPSTPVPSKTKYLVPSRTAFGS